MHSNHHLAPQSRDGSDNCINIRRIQHNIHVALHQLFENDLPHEQIARVVAFNSQCLTDDFKVRINEALKDAYTDSEYVYKN